MGLKSNHGSQIPRSYDADQSQDDSLTKRHGYSKHLAYSLVGSFCTFLRPWFITFNQSKKIEFLQHQRSIEVQTPKFNLLKVLAVAAKKMMWWKKKRHKKTLHDEPCYILYIASFMAKSNAGNRGSFLVQFVCRQDVHFEKSPVRLSLRQTFCCLQPLRDFFRSFA